MEDTFRDLHWDLREDFVDFKDMADLLGDPSMGVGDPFDEDKEDVEVKGPLLDSRTPNNHGDTLKDLRDFGEPLDEDEDNMEVEGSP